MSKQWSGHPEMLKDSFKERIRSPEEREKVLVKCPFEEVEKKL
jgi:hypothetical protein